MTTLVTPRTTSQGQASWLTASSQVYRRWMTNTLRKPWGVGMSLIQPIVWILLFGSVFKAVGNLPGFGSPNYITFLVPGVLMMTVLYTGAWAGTGFIDDMNSGVMDRMISTPISRTSLLSGQIAQQLTTSFVQSIIVVLIGLAGGARFDGGVGGVLLALVAATLLAATFCSFSDAVALLARNQIALISISQLIVLPATFLSSAMMAPSLQPGWVQTISTFNPMTWATETGRAGMSGIGTGGDYGWAQVGWHLGALALLAALTFVWAGRCFRTYQRSL